MAASGVQPNTELYFLKLQFEKVTGHHLNFPNGGTLYKTDILNFPNYQGNKNVGILALPRWYLSTKMGEN